LLIYQSEVIPDTSQDKVDWYKILIFVSFFARGRVMSVFKDWFFNRDALRGSHAQGEKVHFSVQEKKKCKNVCTVSREGRAFQAKECS